MSAEQIVQQEIKKALQQPVDMGGDPNAGMYTSAQPVVKAHQEFALASAVHYEMRVTDLNQMWWLAEHLCRSSFVPSQMRGDVTNVFISMMYGMEVGLRPIHAIQNIMEVQGRMAIWGDAMLALIQANPLCEDVIEEIVYVDGEGLTAQCTVKRKGRTDTRRIFSEKMAKQANLWQKRGKNGKETPWVTYPERMLQMRARSWACRDSFPDALHGLIAVEEAWDIPSETPVEQPKQSQSVYKPEPEKVAEKYQPSIMAYQGAKKLADSVPVEKPAQPTPQQIQALKDDLAKCPLDFQEKMDTWITSPQPDGLGLESIDKLLNGQFNTIRLRVTRELNDRALDIKENVIKLTQLAKNIPVEFLVGYLENEISEGHLDITLRVVNKIADLPPEGVEFILDNFEAIKELHKIHKPINNKQYKELRDALASQGLTEKMVLDYLNTKGFGLASLAKLPHSALERVIKEIPSLGALPPIED